MERLIQVVEDDADIRFIVEYILEDESYVVDSFENASSFIGRARKKDVALFILDVMLPDGNGIELSKALKADELTSNIPVIIMSAHSSGEQAFREGKADGFIHKPFDISVFLSYVNDVLKTHGKQLSS